MSRDDLAQSWLTIEQASAAVFRSRATIDRWIADGRLHPVDIPAALRRRGQPRKRLNELEVLEAERAARHANPAG